MALDQLPHSEDTYRWLMKGLPAALIGAFGWLSLRISKWINPQWSDVHLILGGTMFSGFVGWSCAMILTALHFDPMLAAPIGAVVGSAGERGYSYIWSSYISKKNGGL